MGKHASTIRAIAQFGAQSSQPDQAPEDQPAPQPAIAGRCDWCGFKTEHLTQKFSYDGSAGGGRNYDMLCRKCGGRYNQEAKEYKAKHK